MLCSLVPVAGGGLPRHSLSLGRQSLLGDSGASASRAAAEALLVRPLLLLRQTDSKWNPAPAGRAGVLVGFTLAVALLNRLALLGLASAPPALEDWLLHLLLLSLPARGRRHQEDQAAKCKRLQEDRTSGDRQYQEDQAAEGARHQEGQVAGADIIRKSKQPRAGNIRMTKQTGPA